MTRRLFQIFLITHLLTGILWAANDPFVGKWKLNSSKSRMPDRMKVATAGENRYALTFSGDNIETIVADGTDQPALYDSTLSITVLASNTWKVVRKAKDKDRLRVLAIWTLSKDGKTLTDDFTGYRDDGSVAKMLYVYERSGEASGFVGTWQSISEQMLSAYKLEIQSNEGDGLSFNYPDDELTKKLKFDGKDYLNSGQGSSSSGHRVRTLQITDKINHKVVQTEDIELSQDLKTMTVTLRAQEQDKPMILCF
ncbi:MAG TPA: hypothetical protein VKZ53_23605 [Candidatus Angelobacter sp.]|nr:hypothetical protein [Candidatus Angelobacter sp.]